MTKCVIKPVSLLELLHSISIGFLANIVLIFFHTIIQPIEIQLWWRVCQMLKTRMMNILAVNKNKFQLNCVSQTIKLTFQCAQIAYTKIWYWYQCIHAFYWTTWLTGRIENLFLFIINLKIVSFFFPFIACYFYCFFTFSHP